MNERKVVGYDGTEPSRAALRWALARPGPIVLAHIVDDEGGTVGEDFRAEEERRGWALVAEVMDELAREHPEVPTEVALLDGPVAWALTEYAGSDDLLVVGTHKTGFLHGRVLGSRSVEVAVLARSNVAVVPSTDLRFRVGVVAGIDDQAELRPIVSTAAREAERRHEELLLIQSTPTGHTEHDRVVAAEAMMIARETAPGITIRSRTSNRGPAELLLDAARDRALLVIGAGTGDRARSPIGTVLHDVLLNLTAPTLIARVSARPALPSAPLAMSTGAE